MPVLDHFGILAPFYERVIRLKTAETISELARLPVQGALLDAGGGTGRVTGALSGKAGSRVVIDVSRGMLSQAYKKPGLKIAQAVTEKLPFGDATFERIIMIDALHHVEDHALTCLELWRVLQPGGRIVIEEPDIRNLATKFVALGEKLALMRSHFVAPPVIAGLFSRPNSRTEIIQEGWNSWIIVDKL